MKVARMEPIPILMKTRLLCEMEKWRMRMKITGRAWNTVSEKKTNYQKLPLSIARTAEKCTCVDDAICD